MEETFLVRLFEELRERTIKNEIPKNCILCDIGCGFHARYLKKLKNIIKKGIGIDQEVENYKDNKLILINKKIKKKIPLKSNSVEVFILLAVLEHMFYPQEVINELYRILKKEGKVIITTPSKQAKPILETLAFLGLVDPNFVFDHQNYFSKKHLHRILKKAKFRNIKIKHFQLGFNTLTIAYK